MIRKVNVVLTAAAAVTLSAAPLSAQWGDIIFGRRSSDVPAGHMPSRGMCRVWIDGVSPGRQPRQTDCRTAERQRPYYEQRYGRRARVIYGDRTYGRYEDRNSGGIVLGKRNDGVYDRNGTVYDRNGCRYVDRVLAGRVIRQRVCDNNGGVYDRNDRVYDRNGNVVYRGRDGVWRDRRGRVIRRDRDGDWRDRRGRVYERRRDGRRSDRDSDG